MMIKKIILITILTVIFCCIMNGIYGIVKSGSIGTAIYIAVYSSWNIIIPVLILVLLFFYLVKKLSVKNFIVQVFILLLLSIIGFLIWSVFDLIMYHGGIKGLNVNNLMKHFNSEFSRWIPVTIISVLSIPFLDRKIKPKN